MREIALATLAIVLLAPGIISAKDKITVHGKAVNSKAGAAVVTAKGELYFIEAMTSWPNNVLGKNVAVTGTPNVRKFIPDPEVNPKTGAISQGAKGMQDVLDAATWKVED